MSFCPTNCTVDKIYSTHQSEAVFTKFWSKCYWSQPGYSTDYQKEKNAGLTEGAPIKVEAGAPVFRKRTPPRRPFAEPPCGLSVSSRSRSACALQRRTAKSRNGPGVCL